MEPAAEECQMLSKVWDTSRWGGYKSIPRQDSWGIFSKELASQQLACLDAEQFVMTSGFSYGSILHSMTPPFSHVMFAKNRM